MRKTEKKTEINRNLFLESKITCVTDNNISNILI